MKITLEPKGTLIGKALELEQKRKNFFFRFVTLFLWLAGLLSVGFLVDLYFTNYLELEPSGWPFVFFGIFLFYLSDRAFYFSKLSHPYNQPLSILLERAKKGEEVNIFSALSLESAAAFTRLPKGTASTNADLFISILQSKDINFILVRLGLGLESLKQYISKSSGKGEILTIFGNALAIGQAEGHTEIEIGDIFISLCQADESFRKMLKDLKITLEDLGNLVYWQTYIKRNTSKTRLLDPGRLKLTGGIGRDWAFGWTPFLKRFSVDITRQLEATGLDLEIIGHEKEIKELSEALLRQNGGNALVVGEPGVGKRTTVLGFAKKILEGQTGSALDFQHIIQIDTDYLLSGLNSYGEVAERLTGILGEVSSAGNIILYIENIQNLLSSGDGKIGSAEILMPFLDNQGIHIIATCDIASFNQFIAGNASLMQRFTRVNVEEPNGKEMIRILEDIIPGIEGKNGVLISYEAIKEILNAAEKYIQNLPNPEKSINLTDSIATHVASERGKTIILPKDVDDYITEKYQVPAGEAGQDERTKLINLENIMHQSVIGQNEALSAISNALRRARAGITDSRKPIGTFLFLGPTGVGKTETAKALAKAYFGNEERMLRFDMSEYQNKEDIYRFIGGNVTGETVQGSLTTSVRENPFSLILFDEIEKAHRDILDLFLQLLDEGFITDGFGRKVSFSNTIVIATSNAGANLIREAVKGGQDYENTKKVLLDFLQKENIYRPEFLNRFTSVIAFSPLSQQDIAKVGEILIAKLKKTILKNKGIEISIQPTLISKLAELGYDPEMGARPMARVIQEKIENYLAQKILTGDLEKGDSIMLTEKDVL